MINIRIDTDLPDLIKQLGAQARQIPFATAVALTQTARDVQAQVKTEIPQRFTLRRQWIVQGIRIQPATKSNLTSTVYSRDAFMTLHETGGTKRSIRRRVFEWQDYLAIPLDARRGKTDIVKKEDWPENLIDPFILTARDGRKYLAVHQIGAGKRGPKRVSDMRGKNRRDTGTRLMYTLVSSVQVPKALGMENIARRLVAPRWAINFPNALGKAIVTSTYRGSKTTWSQG